MLSQGQIKLRFLPPSPQVSTMWNTGMQDQWVLQRDTPPAYPEKTQEL